MLLVTTDPERRDEVLQLWRSLAPGQAFHATADLADAAVMATQRSFRVAVIDAQPTQALAPLLRHLRRVAPGLVLGLFDAVPGSTRVAGLPVQGWSALPAHLQAAAQAYRQAATGGEEGAEG